MLCLTSRPAEHITSADRPAPVSGLQTTTYEWDQNLAIPDVATQYDPSGTSTTFVYGPTGPLQTKTNNQWTFTHQNSLGSTVATSNSAGAATGTRRYSAYGDTWTDTGTIALEAQRFASGTWEQDTQTWFLKARYLDPKTATFLSRDPIPIGIGSPHQSPYTYVWGQPTVLTDPTGMLPDQDTCGAIGWVIDKASQGTCSFSAIKTVFEVSEVALGIACAATAVGIPVCAAAAGSLYVASNLYDNDPTTQPSIQGLAVAVMLGALDGAAGAAHALAKQTSEQAVERAAREAGEELVEETGERIARRTISDVAGATCSFSGSTLVLMADGTRKPIEDIIVGDVVLATDPETGETAPREVTHLWVHEDTLIDLGINGELITTTEDHPFWNETDHEWQRADQLNTGDLVRNANGASLKVEGIKTSTARTDTAYNLTVNNFHTYYVGAGHNNVLVHNTCGDEIATNSGPLELGPGVDSNPWMPGEPITSMPAPAGTWINMAMAPGQVRPGAFGTFDEIPSVDFVRNDLAVTPSFKPDVGNVQTFEVPAGTQIQIGTVGPQTYGGVTYPGGANQVQILPGPGGVRPTMIPVGPPQAIR